ncbi:MAG: PAS domain-containing protein [Desulfobacter sp.]|nr:PAS domain-containing protein [Desulfobacter sp.]WDP85058.1 MAG: PAS domain-containing protein [Desulfobacter sp.]
MLQKYIPIVKFLAEALGPQFEIVLHDLKNIDQSIVAIENNQISERVVGGPATDLLLKLLKKGSTTLDTDFITNYQGCSKNGKNVKGSTLLIKDDNNKVIGALCINLDISAFVQTRNELDKLINLPTGGDRQKNVEPISEKLDHSIEDLTSDAIKTILVETNIPPERMSLEEKMQIIKALNQKGIFLLKGAVSEIAKHLKTSEPTIYRYLNKLK